MSAPFTIRTNNDQLYVSMYASQYRSSNRLYEQDLALYNEADAPEVIVRDAATCATMDQFCHEIAATGNSMAPGGKDEASTKWAQIVDEMIQRTNIRETVYELSGYTFWGRAYAYANGVRKWDSFADLPGAKFWSPTTIQDIDHRQFIFVPVTAWDNGKPRITKVKRQFASASSGRYEDERPEFSRNVIEIKWGDSASRLGYGRGLVNSIFFMWRAKTTAMQYGLQGLQRWAEGLLTVELDIDRPASSDLDNATLAADMLQKIRDMKSGNVAVFPKGSAPQLHETSGSGHGIVAWFINYCDAQIARLILGSGMPTGAGEDAGSAGSEGKAVVQERSTTRRIQFHRARIEECLDRTLIKQIHDLNLPQRLSLGLGAAKQPRFKITDDQHKDPLAAMELVKAMRENKMEVVKAWAYELAGAPVPKGDEPVLEAAADPAPPLPGMGGLGNGDQGPGGPNNEDRLSRFRASEPAAASPVPATVVFPMPATPAAPQNITINNLPQNVPAPNFTIQLPETSSIADAQEREAMFRAQIEAQKRAFSEAMGRELVINVAAPVVENRIDVQPSPAPDVTVPVTVNVPQQPPPVVEVKVDQPAATVNVSPAAAPTRKLKVIRDKNGQITGASFE